MGEVAAGMKAPMLAVGIAGSGCKLLADWYEATPPLEGLEGAALSLTRAARGEVASGCDIVSCIYAVISIQKGPPRD